MRTFILFITVFSLLPSMALSATIRVPADQPTIQAGIDAAVDGDTVLVAPGTYVENIDFKGKAITVKSDQGAKVTVIDGNYAGRVLTFKSGEGPDAVLDGFTVTHGEADEGGGIFCSSSSPTIKNNIIKGNLSDSGWEDPCGGGIACFQHSSPTISNNLICWNTATDNSWGTAKNAGYGGGIYIDDTSSPFITNNIIFGNSASPGFNWLGFQIPSYGGGICCYNSALTVSNTIIWDNQATYDSEISGDPEVKHCNIKGGYPGTGNIDSDPLFVDPAGGDFHLTFNSPCRASGDNAAVTAPTDFEGDPRIAYGTVDMGADEFHTHLYYTGNATPGGSVELKFTDLPGAFPVGFWIAFDALESPIPGAYGDWWLLPPMTGHLALGSIPSNGVYVLPGTLPESIPGPYTLYLQALIGMKLTNLCTMKVK